MDEYTFKPDWNDQEQEKYYPVYDFEHDEIYVNTTYDRTSNATYFESIEKFDKFVEKVEVQDIKHFLFDIWE